MVCKRCDGIGTVLAGCECHPNDPRCRHPDREEECERCDGAGRLCPECRESMALTEPADATECRDCLAVAAEDAAREGVAHGQ